MVINSCCHSYLFFIFCITSYVYIYIYIYIHTHTHTHTLFSSSPPLSGFTSIFQVHFPWLRWDSFDAVCTPKPRCLFCPDSVGLGKYFLPNLQNGICVAMDGRQVPDRVNINNQSCRPQLFGLVIHSGSWERGGTCRSRTEWRANNGKHWPPSSELAPGTQSSVR